VLVRAGFAAVGGSDAPFKLDLISPSSDPWEAWSTGGPPPPRPGKLVRARGGKGRLARPKAEARAAADQKLAARLGPDPGEAGPSLTVSPDPVGEALGATAPRELRERYLETSLGGSDLFTVNKLQSFDAVQITGATFSRTLTRNDLQQVVGGVVFPLGPQLLGVLSSQGIAPDQFAAETLKLF
jgi:hypothetical protein